MLCEKCNHTGLLPFVKDGKIIPHSFIDCECKLSLPEPYNPARLKPEDFDFPMSHDCYRSLCREHGWKEPPDIEPKERPPQDAKVRHTYFHIDNSRRITAKLNAMDGAVKYLLEKEKGGKKKYQGSYF